MFSWIIAGQCWSWHCDPYLIVSGCSLRLSGHLWAITIHVQCAVLGESHHWGRLHCVESVLLTLTIGKGRKCTAYWNGNESELDKMYFHLPNECTEFEADKKCSLCTVYSRLDCMSVLSTQFHLVFRYIEGDECINR